MITGYSAALSALNAFSEKLALVAHNVANSATEGFKKKRAVLQEDRNGGVSVSSQTIDAPGGLISRHQGDKVDLAETSNVDIGEEIVQMNVAERGHGANLKSLEVQNELLGTILDIVE